jgi:hypothetical protein
MQHIGQTSRPQDVKHRTTTGFMTNNEIDTHADMSCAGANWSLMELRGKICDVNPFLASYQPVYRRFRLHGVVLYGWTRQPETDSMERRVLARRGPDVVVWHTVAQFLVTQPKPNAGFVWHRSVFMMILLT